MIIMVIYDSDGDINNILLVWKSVLIFPSHAKDFCDRRKLRHVAVFLEQAFPCVECMDVSVE